MDYVLPDQGSGILNQGSKIMGPKSGIRDQGSEKMIYSTNLLHVKQVKNTTIG